MLAARRQAALRPRRAVAAALICGLAAALVASVAARAATAPTGQIVWSASNGIWAMNDDGTNPHELLSAASPPLARLLPSGTVAEPDVNPTAGRTVLFLGLTSAYTDASLPAACGADCSGTFELKGGVLTQLGPPAAAATGAAYYESQPRITADGQELFDSALYTGIVPGALGTPASAVVERPLAQNATGSQWSSTNAESEPAAGFDPAPDPADRTMAAWVESQGCDYQYPNGQGVEQSSCQYAVHFGAAANAAAPVVIYDNEFVSAAGRGPTSLDLSSDGTMLLLVDPYAPNDGIYKTTVAGMPGSKAVTEVVAQPAQDNSDPSWTSATATLEPLRVAVTARITAASGPAAAVRVGRPVTLIVKLSAPATIVVRIARRVSAPAKPKTIGSLSATGKTGTNSVSIRLVAGTTLRAGSYTASVALRGSSAPARTVHFSVRA
jgi:hypothetical protein